MEKNGKKNLTRLDIKIISKNLNSKIFINKTNFKKIKILLKK